MSGISWGGEEGERLAISYCSPDFLGWMAAASCDGFLFSARDPTSHWGRLSSTSSLTCLQFNPRDEAVVGGGSEAGGVGWWDTRLGGERARTVSSESHSDPVYGLVWTHSKAGTEMMTASADGTVKFWDVRRFSQSLETFILDMENKDRKSAGDRELAQPVSYLEWDSTIPSKFMLGTEGGRLVTCSRKARSQPDTITARFTAHHGAVRCIERNPAFSKYNTVKVVVIVQL